jgi:hypothetical protein
MKRVYIAGKLNDMACDYIKNVHRMIVTAEQVRKAGFAVYVPCIDLLQGMVFGNFGYDDYFDNSQAWLDASDAVFLTPGWETSEGTKREIQRAQSQGIHVFSDINELVSALMEN